MHPWLKGADLCRPPGNLLKGLMDQEAERVGCNSCSIHQRAMLSPPRTEQLPVSTNRTVVLEKTLDSPMDSKEVKPVHPKGNQPWIFIGRTDAEVEAPILWPPDGKSWLIEKTLMLGKTEGKRRRGRQRTRWLDGITNSVDMNLSKLRDIVKNNNKKTNVQHGYHFCFHFCPFLSFFQFYSHMIDIQHCISLRCTASWFDLHPSWNDHNKLSEYPSSHVYAKLKKQKRKLFLVMRTLRIYAVNKFQR